MGGIFSPGDARAPCLWQSEYFIHADAYVVLGLSISPNFDGSFSFSKKVHFESEPMIVTVF